VGTTIVGGMLLSTVLNLIFIPVLYVLLSRLLNRKVEHSGASHEMEEMKA
jgi:hydrophobic/amphiphilic exporter-1 (mainly G- bacteria), HAE1 family